MKRTSDIMPSSVAVIAALSVLIMLAVLFSVPVSADTAEKLTDTAKITAAGYDASPLYDGSESTYIELSGGSFVKIESETPIGSLYVIFDRIYGEWTLSSGERDVICGKNSFLHEFVDVNGLFGYAPTSLTLTFNGDDCNLSELSVFGIGDTPDSVQKWLPPCERADVLLASTHTDDEQLFFAGVLPYFAGELGLNVQVVYFTDPFRYHDRPHEQLNGLWCVGVRNYPVSGEFYDAYSESLDEAYSALLAYGYAHDDFLRFQVDMLRRFRPLVVIGHDFGGEYGHGAHMLNAKTLAEALPLAADAAYYPESAEQYGVWSVNKAYFHLYDENQIYIDWDTPLEAFGGKTAFEMTQQGFMNHKSQHWTWFYRWIYGKNTTITKASEIKTYSPCKYGLYYTNVGYDTGNDMLENIKTYAVLDAEAEAARLAAESEAESIRAAESESRRIAESEEESRRAEMSAAMTEATSGDDAGNDDGDGGSDITTTAIIIICGAALATGLIIPQIINENKRTKNKRK